MDESDVGILCYISSLPGFRGILKQRYTDFIVNEVDLDGNVVHLTSLLPPPPLAAPPCKEPEVKKGFDGATSENFVQEIDSFRDLVGDSDAHTLEELLGKVAKGGVEGKEKDIAPVVLSPSSDKAHRTAIHHFFKDKLKFLETDTIDGPDASSKCIRVRLSGGVGKDHGRNSKKRKERGDKPFDRRGSDSWPEHLGKFLRFHLYKENKDTQEALGLIGKMLGIQPRSFGFAGTKDKRSVSTQRVTVFKQQASRLAALNDRLIGIKVGDFCHVNEGLVLGQLLGNRFTVTLRGVVADSEDTIKASADCLGRQGFINYFGLQRFGSGSVPTHLVGAALLRGEWRSSVSMILDPREGERETVKNAREYYKESGDIEGTLKQLPRHMVAERAILQCLQKHPGNYLQALKAIPRTLRMMYVHSYQSYLWNHAASMRVEKYGSNNIVLGDLVYYKADGIEDNVTSIKSECDDNNCDDSFESMMDEASGIDLPAKKNILVKAVTEEDISSGNYTVDDVILPMPGSRIIYPGNEVAEVYHDLAKKDGISLTESVHNVKEFSITSMTGSYRRVFQKLMDYKWELLTYANVDTPLVETDLDKIRGSNHMNKVEEEEEYNGQNKKSKSEFSEEPVSSQNGIVKCHTEKGNENDTAAIDSLPKSCSVEPQTALKLSFTLPASSYATMAVRELLKTSTSVAFHKTLNL